MSGYNGQFDQPTNFDFLDQFGAEAKPVAKSNIKPGLEVLKDGPHEFVVVSQGIKNTNQHGQILELVLRVDDGVEIQHGWWLNSQDNVNALLADMGCLGFATNTWAGPHFKSHFAAALPKLVGLRFAAAKSTRPNKDNPAKPYVNLYITGLVKSASMPAAAAGFNEFAAPPSPGNGVPAMRF